jgi:hypothetical protein
MDTEIYINGTLIDLYDKFPMSLNYAIADIVHPDKRNANYSKTIKIPGSKTNDALFGYIFSISKEVSSNNTLINFAPDFNPNLKADCVIYRKTLLQFKGYVQLLQINSVKGKREYEIAVYGNVADIFTELEGINLSDLDFSEFDHTFTKAHQKESWDTRIQNNGSNYTNFSGGAPTGEGYVYPIIDYGYRPTPDNKYEVLHLYPAIYLKQYIDKIFEFAGFTYTCSFFQSEFFRRLIIPFSSELVNLTPTEVDNRKFKAGLNSDIVFSDTGLGADINQGFGVGLDPVILNNDTTGGNFDNSSQYDVTTGFFTVGKSGYYDLNASFTVNFDVTLATGSTTWANPGGQAFGQAFFLIKDTSGNNIGGGGGDGKNVVNFGDFTFNPRLTNVYLQKGWSVRIAINAFAAYFNFPGATANDGAVNVTIKHTGATFYNAPVVSPILEGDLMQLNSTLPKDIGAKDLFQSIITMFNLYVDIDPSNEKNLLIEPAKDFYTNNSVVDWTSKLDLNKEIWIRPVSEIEGKDYRFSYKEDSDYYNQKYQDVFQQTYGEVDYQVRNDFVKGTKEIQVIFSPTPGVGNFDNGMVVPTIIKQNEDLTKSPQPGRVRLLYYGGVKSAGGIWTYKSTSSGDSTETTYPYAGHLDDPYNPTVDILFNVPKQLYYAASSYTTNNVYNIYWKQFIEEITDRDSKLITAYFHLRPIDIFKLSFKNFIHVDGINYRLNQILDYDPNVQDSFKVELSKVRKGVPFVPVSIEVPPVIAIDNIIEGGKNEVRNLSATSPIYIIEGGLDAVINFGSANNIQIVNGGKD